MINNAVIVLLNTVALSYDWAPSCCFNVSVATT